MAKKSAAPKSVTNRRSNNRSSSFGVGGSLRGTANASKQGLNEADIPPIMFDGKEISTIHDLIDNFKLDTYEEAKAKREAQVEDPDNPIPHPNDIDDYYWDLIHKYRPNGAYYEHSHGDKLLYM